MYLSLNCPQASKAAATSSSEEITMTQLYTHEKPVPTLGIIMEDDPRSNTQSVVFVQVTSEPPDNHLWKIVKGSETVMNRTDLEASYKHIELTE